MLYLGIDQHRKQLTICLRNEQGDITLQRQVSTQWERVREFLAELQQKSMGEGGFVAMVEVCGFNDWLLQLLDEYGARKVVLVQPEKQSNKKTDRRDANSLGEILWVNRHRLLEGQRVQGVRCVRPATEKEAENRQLTALRQRLGRLRTRTLNKVKHLLRKHNLEQECPTKGLDTKKGKAWLRSLVLGRGDRLEMDMLLTQWDLWDQQIATLEQEIQERQRQDPLAVIVSTIPGCGAYSSLALASRIGPIERFPRPASLANYWGLTPGCRNSGDVTDRLGSITKQGSAMARFILGQLVLHVLRRDGQMRAWFARIKRRRGAKIARVAVMRRLATILWHMVKYQQPYILGGPPRKAA